MCSSMFQIMFFKGAPNSTTLLSLMVCPKFSPFCVYSWAQRGDTTCSCKIFYFEELQKFQFFFFLLDNDPIKMGPCLIIRSNNHRHKYVWASSTIFPEIYGSGWGQREREKKRNGVIFLYNLHLWFDVFVHLILLRMKLYWLSNLSFWVQVRVRLNIVPYFYPMGNMVVR